MDQSLPCVFAITDAARGLPYLVEDCRMENAESKESEHWRTPRL
jgi:hypothetical protein